MSDSRGRTRSSCQPHLEVWRSTAAPRPCQHSHLKTLELTSVVKLGPESLTSQKTDPLQGQARLAARVPLRTRPPALAWSWTHCALNSGGKAFIKVVSESVETGCLISTGRWLVGGTCAGPLTCPVRAGPRLTPFPAGYSVTGSTKEEFYLTTSKGPCQVSRAGVFTCASRLKPTSFTLVRPSRPSRRPLELTYPTLHA